MSRFRLLAPAGAPLPARTVLSKALCIVPSGLYGMPGDLVGLEVTARAFGTFLVNDAAQCFGATQDARSPLKGPAGPANALRCEGGISPRREEELGCA